MLARVRGQGNNASAAQEGDDPFGGGAEGQVAKHFGEGVIKSGSFGYWRKVFVAHTKGAGPA